MTGEELKAARLALGLSQDEFAQLVRVSSGRTVRKWEDGERQIPGPVTVLVAPCRKNRAAAAEASRAAQRGVLRLAH